MVLAGYESPSVESNKSKEASSAVASAASAQNTSKMSDIESVSMAASVATNANLSVADSVSSQSISTATSAELEQSSATAAVKPQLSDSGDDVTAIVSYVTVEGDNAATVADKYGISAQTVRWANNLTDDTVAAGSTLTIPVVDGIVYTVKEGDTLQSIADRYGSSVENIEAFNNISADTIKTDVKLILPGGILPESERPGYRAPTSIKSTSSKTVSASNYVPYSNGNTYAYGYCTWYAYARRIQLGLNIPSNLGNANTWDNRAQAAGYLVNRTPSVGAVFQTDAGYAGHVGVVEAVYPNGTILISEMNAHYGIDMNGHMSGWGKVSHRIINNPGDYKYIH